MGHIVRSIGLYVKDEKYHIFFFFFLMALPFSVVQRKKRRLLFISETLIFNWKWSKEKLLGCHFYLSSISISSTYNTHLLSSDWTEHNVTLELSFFFILFDFIIFHTNAFFSWLTYMCSNLFHSHFYTCAPAVDSKEIGHHTDQLVCIFEGSQLHLNHSWPTVV